MTTWTDILGDAMGRMFDQGVYPETSQEFAARTGVAPTSIYTFQEESGSVLDKVGSNHLAVVGTPTFRYSVQGRQGVYYDAATDGHDGGDIHAVGSSSFVFGKVYALVTNSGTTQYTGTRKTNAASPDEMYGSLILLGSAQGYPQMFVRDGVSVAQYAVGVGTIDVRTSVSLHLELMQVDRAASLARGRMVPSTGVVAATNSASIAGFGDLDEAGQRFCFGLSSPSVASTSTGLFFGYAFIATGAQCEGASVLQNISRGLGWE